MDFVAVLTALKTASPLVIAVFFLVWVINRYFNYKEKEREDDRFFTVREGQEVLNGNLQVMASEIQHNHTEKMRNDDKSLAVLERIEALLITANAAPVVCPKGEDGCFKDTPAIMPLSVQRRLVSYQWSWCRNEVIATLSSSIKRNGIKGNENLVSRRVFHAFRNAANEAKYSVDRLEVVNYPYEELFTTWAASLWDKVWDIAIPIYFMPNKNEVEQALDDLAYQVEALFEEALQSYFTENDNDSTDKHLRSEGASGEWSVASLMAEKLKEYPKTRRTSKSASEASKTPPRSAS